MNNSIYPALHYKTSRPTSTWTSAPGGSLLNPRQMRGGPSLVPETGRVSKAGESTTTPNSPLSERGVSGVLTDVQNQLAPPVPTVPTPQARPPSIKTPSAPINDPPSPPSSLKLASIWDQARAWMGKASAKWTGCGDGTSVVVATRLPPQLARFFPSRAPRDPSPAHMTVLYLGDVPPSKWKEIRRIFREASETLTPQMLTTLSVDAFPERKGEVPHYLSIHVGEEFKAWRASLVNSFRAAGVHPKDHGTNNWKPHATLAYIPEGLSYDGLIPHGSWEMESVELWGIPGPDVASLRRSSGEMTTKVAGPMSWFKPKAPPSPDAAFFTGLQRFVTAPVRGAVKNHPFMTTAALGSLGLYGAHQAGQPVRQMAKDYKARHLDGGRYRQLYQNWRHGSGGFQPSQGTFARPTQTGPARGRFMQPYAPWER